MKETNAELVCHMLPMLIQCIKNVINGLIKICRSYYIRINKIAKGLTLPLTI
ncbi:hypothetical protein JK636_08830 [Clostridium sp. YIM B02515]|uniref:Transposase n=1 Tax=Clostridium rhizosphaerae TaxID=2803861 RepID=A0ABS1T948_9CLOT|nr:hypothetical protein [Clostridium rhizosphaerae]MBL4935863.1 hypothetical protein [Clostridium rhizosphaerae]